MFRRRARAAFTAVRAHLLAVVALAFSTAAAAQGRGSWRLAPALAEPVAIVTVELVWHDTASELRRAVQTAHTSATGHAVLVRDEHNGSFRCTVHAVRVRGSVVDGERTLSLGHEIAHCLGLVHR